VGIAALVPGAVVGGTVAGYLVAAVFGTYTSLYDLPFAVIAFLGLVVYTVFVIVASVGFARLYYALGLSSKLEDHGF